MLYRYVLLGSRGIEPTRNGTHFLKIGFVVAGVGFIPIISDKERKIVRKMLSFMHTKRFNACFKRWVQFLVGAIPRLPFFSESNLRETCCVNEGKCDE